MKRHGSAAPRRLPSFHRAITAPAIFICASLTAFCAQNPPADMQERLRLLTDAVDRVQHNIDDSQRQLADLKQQLAELRAPATASSGAAGAEQGSGSAADLSAAVAAVRETQAIHDAQIATLAQAKVESESKYPLKINGLVLLTGFVNTARTDVAQTPTIALDGAGATGATIRQTLIGLDARGPHLFGAASRADIHLDFDGNSGGSGYNGSAALGVPRLRTAHAELNWQHSQAFFSLDRPLLNPSSPTSLTAVSTPALAWSGNLWAWNPQLGASHDFLSGHAAALRVQAALMDVADPPQLYPAQQNITYTPPSTAELSRWPAVQARVAVVQGNQGDFESGVHVGLSGYFAPHHVPGWSAFDSWAGAVDVDLPVTRFTRIAGNAYRGQALGGLGAGAYKDYVARTAYGDTYFRALDDIGGWLQWKQRGGERFEFNEAIGIDNVPAHQLRPFAVSYSQSYYNLARNRTFTANVIYSPSAYLLFSLEYRRIASSYVNANAASADVIGLAAGYRF